MVTLVFFLDAVVDKLVFGDVGTSSSPNSKRFGGWRTRGGRPSAVVTGLGMADLIDRYDCSGVVVLTIATAITF